MPLRIACGALLGACAALAARWMNLSGGQAATLWIPTAFAMIAAACGRWALKRPLRGTGLVFCASGLLGGVVQALYGVAGSLAAAYAVGCVCTVCIAACAIRSRRTAADAVHVYVRCTGRRRTGEFDAIADSGNTLRDYLTHRPVIVMPEADGMDCFAGESYRLMIADTAGGRQMMRCFTPEETILRICGKEKRVRAVVALSSGMTAGGPVLVPCALLEETNMD